MLKKNNIRKIYCILSAMLLISVAGCTSIKVTTQKKPPIPFPSLSPTFSQQKSVFEDMTIPSLRQREYISKLGEVKKISQSQKYQSFLTSYDSEGLNINALLTIPTGPAPQGGWPAIIFVHGYIPPDLYKTTERYGEYVNALANAGFVVLKIDLRGHGESQGQAAGGYYSSDYVIDTLSARAALQSAEFVDKNKIGLWGHSMAGNVLLRSFAARPEIPAVVVWAGAGYTYGDLQEYKITDNSYRPQPGNSETQRKRQELFKLYGQFDPQSEFWKQVAPTNYLSELQGAIQLHHAQDDTVVSIKYSENLNKLFDATSVKHSFYEYPTGGHNITGTSFSIAMQRTIDFYKNYLK